GMLPLAAVLARADLDVLGDLAIGHYTHEKNPLLATAGLTTLAIIRDEALVGRAETLGIRALDLGRDLATRHRLIGDVRGRGLQLGIELVRDRTTKEPAWAEAEAILYLAL